MSYSNPSAPPPSYNDLNEKNPDNNGPPMGFQSIPTNAAQYNYSQMPMMPQQGQMAQQPVLMQQPIQVQPQTQQIIVVQGGPMEFGPAPTRMMCPSCGKNIVTRIEHKTIAATHVIAGMLCIMGCCCFAPIPYFIDTCKSSVHYCSECDSYLGTFTNSGGGRRYNRGYGYN